MPLENFAVRPDYVPNISRAEVGTANMGTYWNKQRIRLSHRYQYGVYRLAYELARKSHANTIFDVACGPATKLNSLFGEDFDLYGFDVAEAVAICDKLHPRGTYVVTDLEKPESVEQRGFPVPDLIICADVIEHLRNPDGLLQSIRKLASDRTWLVISTPDRERLNGRSAVTPANPEHVREWSLKEFRHYLEHSGFEVYKHTNQPPFRMLPDTMTARFIVDRMTKRLPLRAAQLAICKKT